MKRYLLFSFLIVSFALIAFATVSAFDVSYPIAELGNCGSQQECKAYCDQPDNFSACIDFAERQGLFAEDEANRMREMSQPEEMEPGPGGCMSPSECDNYCRVEENLDECLNYSVAHGYTSQEEADAIRAQADRGGPGGCKSKEECDIFCNDPANSHECFAFVVEEGVITQEEADFMAEMMQRGPNRHEPANDPGEEIDEEKVLAILEEMDGPGGCKTMDECEAYCGRGGGEHEEECMAFAIEHELFPPEALKMIKKMQQMGGPGGCRGPAECDMFCSQPENWDTCMNFSRESGMFSPDQIRDMEREMEIGRKLEMASEGPGGCQGPQECNNFCSNPENMEECMQFSADMGMMDPMQMEMMMREKEFLMHEMGRIDDKRMMMGPPPGANFFDGPPPGDYGQYGPPEGFEKKEYRTPSGVDLGPVLEGIPHQAKECVARLMEERHEGIAPDVAKRLSKECMETEMKNAPMDGPEGMFMPSDGHFGPPEGFEGGPPPWMMEGPPPGDYGQYGPPEGDMYGPPPWMQDNGEFMPPPEGQFGPPEGYDQFGPPEGMMMPVGDYDQFGSPEGYDQFGPPEGMMMPSDGQFGPPPGDFGDHDNFGPPEGYDQHGPPEGMMSPPDDQFGPPPGDMMMPPPDGDMGPPPEGEGPVGFLRLINVFLGAAVGIFSQ